MSSSEVPPPPPSHQNENFAQELSTQPNPFANPNTNVYKGKSSKARNCSAETKDFFKAWAKYTKTRMGLLVTIYALLIIAFGGKINININITDHIFHNN